MDAIISGDIKSVDPSAMWDVIAHIVFRALIMKSNTLNRLELIRDLLPFDEEWYYVQPEKIDKMKAEAESNSSVLSQVFNGILTG
jgi:hypothetical protein